MEAFEVRFGEETARRGYTQVPNLWLNEYHRLGITTSQMMVIIHALQRKSAEDWPWVSIQEIAIKTGTSENNVRKHLQNLNNAGLLIIEERKGHANVLDFAPLLEAFISLPPLASEEVSPDRAKPWSKKLTPQQKLTPNNIKGVNKSSPPTIVEGCRIVEGYTPTIVEGYTPTIVEGIYTPEKDSVQDLSLSQNPPSTREIDITSHSEPEQDLGFAAIEPDPVQPSQPEPEPELLHGETQPMENIEAWPHYTNLKELRHSKAQQLAPPSSEEREALQRRVELLIAAGCSGNMAERIALSYDDRDCAAFAAQARHLTRQRRENGKQGPSAAQMFGAAVKGTWGPDYEFLEEEEDAEARSNRLCQQQQDQAMEEGDEEDREEIIGARRAGLPWRKNNNG